MWIFVINLDRDRDRLTRMVAEAQRVGISFERFVAVDGNHLEPDLRDQFFSADGPHEAAFTAGEIGCYASHLRIHRLLADKTGECALILEDDVHLADDLVDTIDAAMSRAPGWDIIRLSNVTKSVVLPVAALGGGRELVRYWTVPNGTGAYLISRSGAIKFAEAYTKRTLPIDEDLRRPWRSGLKTYGVLPPPVEPDVSGFSQIDLMGRNRQVPARHRFKDAARFRDFGAALKYRLDGFGALGFCRALGRSLVASAVKRVRGRVAAERLHRL
jgi:glycosyl transferase, family 25